MKASKSVDAFEYQSDKNPDAEPCIDAVNYTRPAEDGSTPCAAGELPEDVTRSDTNKFWNDHGSHKGQPSEHTSISPAKAKLMLKEGTAQGHALTSKQRGFLGAVAGKGD